MIELIKEKYCNIEEKIPSVFKDYKQVAAEMAIDLIDVWNIKDFELIRNISLVNSYTGGVYNLSKHIDNNFAFAGLYPHVIKSFNIKPDNFK